MRRPLPGAPWPARVTAIGLMSGTSADGIDAALVDVWREGEGVRVELRAYHHHPYPPVLRSLILRCFRDEARTSELCHAHAAIGEAFADASEALLAVARFPRAAVDFAASHGQTVWHQPPTPGATGATLQLGEAARIAVRLGTPVVCDFRQQDVALGGHGAPLVPYFDWLVFAHPAESRAVQNLGGIGNVTYLPAGGALDAVRAFDTGPGNALMDVAAGLLSGGALACDEDGRIAASCPPDGALLAELLTEPYFTHPPPKSTGREVFGEALVRGLWDRGFRGPALVSTLNELTVESIARAYRAWLGRVDTVILGGGGARNAEMVRRLRRALAPARVAPSADFGIPEDAKEAMAFAVLGYHTLHGVPSGVAAATGAARAASLGKVVRP